MHTERRGGADTSLYPCTSLCDLAAGPETGCTDCCACALSPCTGGPVCVWSRRGDWTVTASDREWVAAAGRLVSIHHPVCVCVWGGGLILPAHQGLENVRWRDKQILIRKSSSWIYTWFYSENFFLDLRMLQTFSAIVRNRAVDWTQTLAAPPTDSQGAGDDTISRAGCGLILWSIPGCQVSATWRKTAPFADWTAGVVNSHTRRSANSPAAPQSVSDVGPAWRSSR